MILPERKFNLRNRTLVKKHSREIIKVVRNA